ncbi:hypothetical protein R3W88_023771 [Solanum pinnatisectum]|uniref:Uncharacterized protein n=1 Tax=Solanum pinnatisectum TaxID=50273 RepID=A0AAV9LZB0_9SOLN|nr:hypothetical protein R3W88_023771 [Solanum pinnatisectum]
MIPSEIICLPETMCDANFLWSGALYRRLCVSVERDTGGTTAAPKTIRFFVPSWISNDSFLYLVYQVVEIELLESADVDSLSLSLSRAVKSVKLALKNPPTSRVDVMPLVWMDFITSFRWCCA